MLDVKVVDEGPQYDPQKAQISDKKESNKTTVKKDTGFIRMSA